MTKKLKKVILGGTFDILHKGHRSLLKKAFQIGDLVTIGLTSDQMARRRKKRKVSLFTQRKKELIKFIKKELKIKKQYKIIKINDIFGPTLKKDFDYIIVSPETYQAALLINKKRQLKEKKPIKIVKIKFVLAENKKPINSTEIVKGLIDREGKLVRK
ncbi:MAG: pantetheine-phosphate adenylyltransferase [Minisyncoccales bacterium]